MNHKALSESKSTEIEALRAMITKTNRRLDSLKSGTAKGIEDIGKTIDKKFPELLQLHLQDYNENNPAMPLVLFEDAMEHIRF